MRFDLRRSDTAVTFIVQNTATAIGVFDTDRTTNQQRVVVVLAAADLRGNKPGVYRYSLKRTDDGGETVLLYGDFVLGKVTAP